MQVISSPEQLDKIINQYHNSVVFLDVDDTLITPVKDVLGHQESDSQYLEQFKAKYIGRAYDAYYHEQMSTYRLTRQVRLTAPTWAAYINAWQNLGAAIYALTQIDTGAIGAIASMEQWRLQELTALKLIFTQLLNNTAVIKLLENNLGYASFYHGIISTGPFNKAEVLAGILNYLSPNAQFIMVDDKLAQLEKVYAFAQEYNLAFNFFHWQTKND